MATLFQTCMVAVCDGCRIGYIKNLDDLPVQMRQLLFAYAVDTGQLRYTEFRQCFESPMFFSGFTDINLLSEVGVDNNDIPSLLQTIAAAYQHDPSSAINVKNLKLLIQGERPADAALYQDPDAHCCPSTIWNSIKHCYQTLKARIAGSYDVQDHCQPRACREFSKITGRRTAELLFWLRSLKRLHLVFNVDCDCETQRSFVKVMKMVDAALIQSNVVPQELVLEINFPMKNTDRLRGSIFSSITCLVLSKIQYNMPFCISLINRCKLSLKKLVLCIYSGDPLEITIPLPCLAYVNMYVAYDIPMVDSVLSLAKLPALRHCALNLYNVSDTDLAAALAQLGPRLHLTVRSLHSTPAYLFSALGPMMTGLEMQVDCFVDNELVKEVSYNCIVLQSLRLICTGTNVPAADEFLICLLTDDVRAKQLRDVSLECYVSPVTLSLLFSKCVRLDRLTLDFSIYPTVQITNENLILFAKSGCQPGLISLSMLTYGISDTGLIAVFRRCCSSLQELKLNIPKCRITYASINCLLEHCKMLRTLNVTSKKIFSQEADFYIKRRMFSENKLLC